MSLYTEMYEDYLIEQDLHPGCEECTFNCFVTHKTEKAVRLRVKEIEFWIPKVCIILSEDESRVTMTRDWAIDKGLIESKKPKGLGWLVVSHQI